MKYVVSYTPHAVTLAKIAKLCIFMQTTTLINARMNYIASYRMRYESCCALL